MEEPYEFPGTARHRKFHQVLRSQGNIWFTELQVLIKQRANDDYYQGTGNKLQPADFFSGLDSHKISISMETPPTRMAPGAKY